MRKAVNILICVLCGIAGGWIGYWIGYAAGWSTNAEWPGQVGGGTRAILMSIGTSVP
jgi:membrane protein DedA with SNARE-associated domain